MLNRSGSDRNRFAGLKMFGLTVLAVAAVGALIGFYALLLWLGFLGARAVLHLF